jgi:pimeloyl-ACP methyl ester carboxylesterase
MLDPADFMPYLEHVTKMDLLLFLRMLRAAGEYSADDFLGSVDVPALVVAGTADSFTPFSLAEKLTRALPKAALTPVAAGTHVAPLEQRDTVGKSVAEFLKEREERMGGSR